MPAVRHPIEDAELAVFYQQGETMAQLATRFGVPLSTIKARFRRGGLATRARGLSPNDGVVTQALAELLDGLLLGDGSILIGRERKTPFFSMTQHRKRAGWVFAIQEEFELAGFKTRLNPYTARTRAHRRTSMGLLRTRCYTALRAWRLRWYPAQTKIVPRTLELTPKVLAHWFFGDGSNFLHQNGTRQLSFATHGFARTDVEYLACMLEKLGWSPRLNSGIRPAESRMIRLNKQPEIDALLDLIRPFAPPCLAYKVQGGANART